MKNKRLSPGQQHYKYERLITRTAHTLSQTKERIVVSSCLDIDTVGKIPNSQEQRGKKLARVIQGLANHNFIYDRFIDLFSVNNKNYL